MSRVVSRVVGPVALAALAACGGDDTVGDLPVASRCAIEAPAATPLATRGVDLVDGLGRRVALRGVNAGGRAKLPPYAPFDFTIGDGSYDAGLAVYLDRAEAWGIDVLRATFSWEAAQPAPDRWDEDYLRRFDALVDGAWQRGIWVIVDFHQDLYADSFCGDGFPSWTLAAPGPPQRACEAWYRRYDTAEVQAAFDAFWSDARGARTAFRAAFQRVVARYRDRPGVIGYEPINEPHPGTSPEAAWAATTLTAFYGDLATLTATVAPGALLFVDTSAFDGVVGSTSLLRPPGDGIVLAPHSYDPFALFGGAVSPEVQRRLTPWADLGRAWNTPVLIGEMGIVASHSDAAVHLRRHLDALEQLGLHGTWWEYSQSALLWNHEDLSLVDGDGHETAMVDELARPYARALAGAVASVAYEPEARRWSLRYAAEGDAPSEIAVPTRLGPVKIGARGACVDARPGRLLVRATGADVELAIEPE